ncbi:TIGR04388 family protein [Leptospira sp. FAT1]|nr:TIGR04388 family protein [Leptospira sanjuanensis]
MNKAGGKSWANGSVNVSASREGHSSLALSYNHDGNTAIPQRLRGGGATLDLGNDGVLGFSIQGLKGATIGNVSYNTNSHGWEQATLNQNFQNEYLQGVTAENSSYNHEKSQMEILRTELSIATKMEKPLFTQADVDKYLPKNKDGSIDVENAQPEKLLEKWNAHKEAMSQTAEGLQKWKDDVTRAGERSGIEIRFNDGKSATSTFGKFVTGMFGDIAQSFGIANDGSKMVDKQGVFHLDTCFRGDVPVWRLKHKENGIYGNVKSPEFSSEDYELIAIEEVKIGDVVQSWNERTGKLENKKVTETFVHEVPQLFFLELDGEDEIHTTWNHPFRRRIVTQNGSNANTNQNRVSPFDLKGIQRDFKTHEHLLHPREARIVTSLVGSGSESETKTASVIEELPHSTDSNHSASDVTLSKTERFSSNTTTQTSEWVKVEDLRLRDQVLKADGSWGTVTGIYYYNTEPTKVYNLEVEENHTYVVGGRETNSGAGYVVHNYEGGFDKGVSAIKAGLKDLMGREGLFGLGAEKPLSGQAKELLSKLNEYDTKDRKLGAERSALITEVAVGQGKKELLGKRNEFLLSVVRDKGSDGIEGVADLRKALKDVNPKAGLNKSQMAAVETWLKKTSGESGLGGGIGLFKGGMQNGAGQSGLKGLLLKAASEAGSAGELAHLNEKLATNQEQLRQKALDHEKVGSDLAKIITHDYANLKTAAASIMPLRIPADTKTLDHTVAENLRKGEGGTTKEITWNDNKYKKQINERTGEVSYSREYSRGVKEEIRVTPDNHIEQKLSWTGAFGFGKKEDKVTIFEANGNEKKVDEKNGKKVKASTHEVELTHVQKDLPAFTETLNSDKHFNVDDKAKSSELREKIFNAQAKDRPKLLDELKKLKIESYARENKLVDELGPEDRSKLIANLDKIYSGSKDSAEASNIVSNLLQKAAGGMTENSFPHQTEFDKKINQGLRTAKNEVKILIEHQKDAFRKKYDSEMVYDDKGNFDIRYTRQDPEYVGFDGIAEMTDYNDSNQNKSNNYTTMKEGKAGLTGKLHDVVDMMRQEFQGDGGKYYYQEELDSALKNKQSLTDLQTSLKSKEKGISDSITSLSSEISKLKKDKHADPAVLAQKAANLETQKNSLTSIKDQLVDTKSMLKKADSQVSYFESRKSTFEESKKWFSDKKNTIDPTKGVASGICYAWSDYALLKGSNLEKRPFDVWYREQVRKGNLSYSTTQAGGAGVFFGKIEETGDGLLAGYKVEKIDNKFEKAGAWNDQSWQPLNYSETMKTLKDQGIKTFKVWIDKTAYGKGGFNKTLDFGGQHYFIVAWNESKGKFMMMDHNDNKEYHNKEFDSDVFKQIRKITYIKPKGMK